MVGGGTRLCDLQELADILKQGTFKIVTLVSVQLERCSKVSNKVIHKLPFCSLSPLVRNRKGFNPSCELVNYNKNVLVSRA